jgi:hypothetical protein
MYNLRLVQEGLKNIVGFRNSQDPQFGKIDSDLTTSETGIYFQSVHPLVTLENLFSIAPNVKEFVFDAYNSSTTYSLGDKVSVGSVVYESLANNNTANTNDTASWKVKTKQSLFSDYLRNLRDDAINKVFTRVVEAKKLRSEVKDVFENLDLYQGVGRASNTIIKEGRFVFYQIDVKRPSNLTVMISSVTTQFNQAQGPLTIYVYNSDVYEPAQEIELDLEKAMSLEKSSISVTLQPGLNYIGYYEDDLVGQALRKDDYFWNERPCACNNYNYSSWIKWSEHVQIKPGYIAADHLPGDLTLWDLSKNVYQYDTNFGLNFALTVGCDITDFLITNKSMFSNAVALQLALDVLLEMAYNMRSNFVSSETKKHAMFALENANNTAIGRIDNYSISAQLERAIKAMDFDLSGLGDCMPCKDKRGIKVSAI